MFTRITDFIWDCIFSLAIFAMTDEDRRKYNDVVNATTNEGESNEQEAEDRPN